MTNWTPEPDEQPKLEYRVQAHIALEDSDNHTWGIAKDTEGSLLWKTGDGPVVGQWSRSPSDGLIHVFLQTPLMALVDKATQHFVEYAERRRATVSAPKTRKPRAPKAMPEPEVEIALTAISNMRKLIGG